MSDGSLATFACPQCGKHWTWKPQLAGKKVKCRCGAVFSAPQDAPSAAGPPDDLYDLSPSHAKAPPPAIPVSPPPVAAGPAATTVLDYRTAPHESPAPRTGRVALDDPFEGNKLKNLYIPLALILGATAATILARTFFLHNASAGIKDATLDMALRLIVDIPTMLLACILAVKLLDTAFGPVGPAILKLSSIALAPEGLSALSIMIGSLLGHTTLAAGISSGWLLGALIGWVLSLVLYFWLFIYYFDLEWGETWRLVILIWFVRTLGGYFLMILMWGLFH